ncbi:PREDICTED: platelet binding protein GspB-like isoform X4 [Rhagoletis zephyria]|uniref:platelet binding protein GspB-like isoform X4 n=1 Tax=Rhagoletis zephyria TaxID=28612 RepID=UPI00081130E5|nr:PREDICTED: platelet binding protein GspB-like isoform X4 [Rhagoletis zephyria]
MAVIKPGMPLVPLAAKPEDKGAKPEGPISKPDDKPKSPLDVTKHIPHTYSSDESDLQFDKPKMADIKPGMPLVPLAAKPEDKGVKPIELISKPDEKPKSPLDVTKPIPQTYYSDESDEELDKPKMADIKPGVPMVPLAAKPEDKGAKPLEPISKPDDKLRSLLEVTKPVPQMYSSDESDDEFDKPKMVDVKPGVPLDPLAAKSENKGTKAVEPISKPDDKPKSLLAITKPIQQTYSSDESDDEFDKPKITDDKQIVPLIPSASKTVENGRKPVEPISKPDDKPKSPHDVIKPIPQKYSSEEFDEEFDKEAVPLLSSVAKSEEKLIPDEIDDTAKPFDFTGDDTILAEEQDVSSAYVSGVSSGVPQLLAEQTTSEGPRSDAERGELSTSISQSRDILDSCSSLDSLERPSLPPPDKRNERAVAYFVNLNEGTRKVGPAGRDIKKVLEKKQDTREARKSHLSSTKTQAKSTLKQTQTKSQIQYAAAGKVRTSSPSTEPKRKLPSVKPTVPASIKQKKQLPDKDEVSKVSSTKSLHSRLSSEARSERSISPRSTTVNVGLSEDNSNSRATTPRPRIRTDVTAIPYNATLRTFSPTTSRPKPDYSHVTSVYAQTKKSEKKATPKKTKTKTITKSSDSGSEDAQRKRLITPTSTVMHRYMQPTLAHSLRYGNTQTTQMLTDIATPLTARSPVPPSTQPKGKQYTTTTTTTNTDAPRRYVRNLSKEEKVFNFKSSLTNLKKDSLSNSKESIKSTEKLYHRKTNVEKTKTKAVIAHSEQITVKEMPPKTSKEMSNVLNKTNQSKLKHKIDRAKEARTARTPRSVTRDSSEEKKLINRTEKTQQRSKVPISVSSNVGTRKKVNTTRSDSKITDVKTRKDNKDMTATVTTKTEQTKRRTTQTKKSDVKVQKKLKDSINESSMTGSGNTSASGSLSSVRRYTRATTNIKKLDKEVANLRLADKSATTTSTGHHNSIATTSKISKMPAVPARTTVVKVHQEPVATTAIVSTVIFDDDAEITRSFRSTESTKSSTSSSGSRKVLTSEVFTKTFGQDKPFEVIYRQPDTDIDTTSIIRPPSTDQRCVNEFDVSFIDTTDSSLSDSVALPMFTTEQDRLLAASPGSPKPTRSPLALIEETLRRQQAAGYAMDPALQMQFGASGIRMGSISPTSSRNSRSEQIETPKETIEEKLVLDEDSFRNLETGFEFAKSSETTPVPTGATTTTAPTSSDADAPTPRPRGAGAKPASPVRDIVAGDIAQCLKSDDATSLQTDSAEILSDLSSTAPVPKPRLQMKPTDSFKNLAALASEHSDSISLRSLDMTEDLSKTDEPSTEISIKSSHARDYPTTTTITTTTTASEDHTESLEPTSEISVDDADTEKSELVDGRGKTSFYIGESSRNIIVKTTPTKPDGDLDASEDTTAAAENVAEATIEAKDIALMKEVSVDSDESNDIFKEYVTMKRETGEAESKIVRQGSETRNDLLEQEPLKEKPTDEDKVSTTFMVTAEISQPFAEEFENILKKPEAFVDDSLTPKSEKFDLQLEKSEWETAEKEIPVDGKPKVVHSPQQLSELPKALIDEEMVARTLEEAQESLNAAKNELKFIVKDGKSIKESPSEFEFRSISQAFSSAEKKEKSMPEADPTPNAAQPQEREFAEMADISSFIGIPDTLKDTTALSAFESAKETTELLFDGTTKETLNKEAVMAHYAREIFEEVKQEGKDEHGSLGFISTGTADDYSSMEEYAAKEEHASLGFVSTETVEDFSSMEDYFQEKMAKASVVTVEGGPVRKSPIEDTTVGSATVFSEISSEQTMKPFEQVTHRIKSESSSTDSTNRWSVPEIDQSSSSESYYKSLDKNDSRPLSSDVDNLLTQGNSSEYQTALDMSSVTRETTEYVSAVSTLQSSSGKTISSHESMKSLDSQSETSANLGSIDVSELSETLVASSTEPDALEAEELARIRDLRADDEDSDDSLEIQDYAKSEQQMQRSLMKRSQEMIFKPKPEESKTEEQQFETVTVEEFPKPKEVERTWGLAYPVDEGKLDDVREPERPEDILLYHGDIRRSIDDSKLASSLDEGSILSVSMSSTSNIETVVENFEDMIGSAGSSSLTGIEAFGFPHDEQPSSFYEHEETFSMEMESKEHSPPDSAATTPPGEARKRGHRRSESTAITGDVLKSITDKELPVLGENKESESESDTDPYESEYTRQFRSPSERKNNKKKKQAAAEMDHSFELEKRPFTPSQLVAEVIVEDSATEEMEAEAIEEERRPSQNMQDYSVIPDITVTEDFQKSPSLEETAEGFEEKSLYKVKTQEELHKAADVPLHEQKRAEKSEETFQKLVQEQYKQKLADLQRPQVGDSDYDDDKAPDSPDSFEMVDQPDISDDFVIIEEVAKEANEVDLGAKSIQIQPTKYESKHDEDVEKIIIKSAPADPKLGSQIFRDDLNFEFEESPPTAGSSSDPQEESDSGDMATSNKRWVEMQLTDTQLRYPYDITGGVLEDIKEEDGEFEVGSSRISSFKDSFSSTPEYDVMAARRYYARGEHDDVSMSSLQEFESLEQAISLENRNKTHQGSTDSSNGSFTRRYMVRHSGSGTAQGDDISISSLKEFEGLENACIEAHLIEIKAKEEAALLSRSDDSNKSNDSDRENGASAVVVSKVTRTVTRTEMLPAQQQNIEALLKQKLEECEGRDSLVKIAEVSTEPLEAKIKLDKQDSEKGSVDSLEINKSLDMRSSSIGSFEISKDATTRSDIDSLETDRKQPTREESIDSMENEQFDLLARFPIAGETTLGEGLTTTTTTTTTTTDAEGHEHIVTQTVTTTTSTSGNITLEFPSEQLPKDVSTDSLCIEQTNTSSAGTTATYQTSAGNSQMSGSVTSCASSTLMEDSYPGAHSSLTSSSFWSHEESTVVEDKNVLEEVLLEDAEALKRRQVQQRSDYDDQH